MFKGLLFSDVEWVCDKCGDFIDASCEITQSVQIIRFCFKQYGRCRGCLADVSDCPDDDQGS